MKKKILCRNIENEEFEVDSGRFVFRPSVYGILIENNKILLSKQWDGYDFPGGGINIDEKIEEALKREVFEETGIKCKPLEIVHGGSTFFHPNRSKKKDRYWNCVLNYFLIEKVGGELSIENFDEEEKEYASMPEWIELEKIDQIKFYNSIDAVEVIKKAKKIQDSRQS